VFTLRQETICVLFTELVTLKYYKRLSNLCRVVFPRRIGLVAEHCLCQSLCIRPLNGRLSAVDRKGRTKFCTGSYSVLAFQLLSSHWSQCFRVRFVTDRLHSLGHIIQAGYTFV